LIHLEVSQYYKGLEGDISVTVQADSIVLVGFLPGGRSFTGVVNCDNWRAPTGDKDERKETEVEDLDEGNGRVMRALYLLKSPDDRKDRRMKGTGQLSVTKRKIPMILPVWLFLLRLKQQKTHYAGYP